MTANVAASIRARLLNKARSVGSEFELFLQETLLVGQFFRSSIQELTYPKRNSPIAQVQKALRAVGRSMVVEVTAV